MYRIYLLLFLLLGGRSHQAGYLVLTSSPMTATDGQLFTLICSRNTTKGQDRQWSRDDTVVFSTTQGSTSPGVANPNIFNKTLSGRINVSCDATQHNVTLRINSAVDNGSMWQCVDNVNGQTSKTTTIYVTVPQSTVTTTPTHSTPTAADITGSTGGESNTIAIAAGAAGGGVAVIAVIIVAAICIRTRRRSLEEDVRDKSRRDRNLSRSAEMLIEGGATEGNEKVMMDNVIYTSSSDVVPAEYSIHDHDQADKDVYTPVKTNADQHEVTDVYAKPHKGRQETPNGDVYAKVNKVKSREGTSDNIEDMYAKPQKDKRNLKSNADAE